MESQVAGLRSTWALAPARATVDGIVTSALAVFTAPNSLGKCSTPHNEVSRLGHTGLLAKWREVLQTGNWSDSHYMFLVVSHAEDASFDEIDSGNRDVQG
jgi:hypothetical protein